MAALQFKEKKSKSSYYRHPLENTWSMMKGRCYNPKNGAFKNYGGRGIKVCDRWRYSLDNFVKDLGEKPSPEHQLDRINNDGNYEPGNVRWATKKEQARNRRTNVPVLGVYEKKYKWKGGLARGWQVYSGDKYIGHFASFEQAVKVRSTYP